VDKVSVFLGIGRLLNVMIRLDLLQFWRM